MEFRPCIDIHNGKVKQIVGGTLSDATGSAKENFVSSQDAAYYANMYKELGLKGGHIIILNSHDSPYYEQSREEAKKALNAYPGGMQIGGGINDKNAREFIDAGASHVIVTSFVFEEGTIRFDRLKALAEAVGREHVVLDLSCRSRGSDYYVVTNRWQTFTEHKLTKELFDKLSEYADEFLVHAVSVEGTGLGVDTQVLEILSNIPYTVTYAGGISAIEDIECIKETGCGNVNFSVGSALDIFGGRLTIKEICACIQ